MVKNKCLNICWVMGVKNIGPYWPLPPSTSPASAKVSRQGVNKFIIKKHIFDEFV